jgi:uncharacterized protein (TIRG00374 family)
MSKGFLFRVALSIALVVALLVYVVDAGEMMRIVRDFDPFYLALALIAVTADRMLMTYKWTVLLKAQGYRLPLFPGVAIYCASMMWGMALPATVGADAIRAAMTAKRGFGGADVVASIVIERMIGFVLALALGLVSLVVLRSLGVLGTEHDFVLWMGAAALVGAVAILMASMNERVVAWVIGRLPRAIRESKPFGLLAKFTAAYHSLGVARGAIVTFGVLTVIEQLVAIAFPWMIALGLGVPVKLSLLLGVLPIAGLISRLPITVDGWGVYESVFVGLMLLAGISAEAALAMAFSGRILQVIAFLPWWLAHIATSGMLTPRNATLHRG